MLSSLSHLFPCLCDASRNASASKDAMKLIIPVALSFLMSLQANASMVRVVEVSDGRTVVVDSNGERKTLRLAGISVVDEARATALLRWTVGTSWILAEPLAGGDYLLFRSPDALFVNRELVLRGYARATQHGIEPESNLRVTYLGEVEPAGDRPVVSGGRAPRTNNGTARRSSASPSRRARTPGARPRPPRPASSSRVK